MLKEPVARIGWAGRQTIEAAVRQIEAGEDVVLELPLAVHHALCVRLRPDAPARETEPLLQEGGIELLQAVADIAGLEYLRELTPHLDTNRWRITVASPHPRIILRHRE